VIILLLCLACLLYVFQHSNVRSVQTSHDGRGSVYFTILHMSLAGFGPLPGLSTSGSHSTSSQGCCSCPDHREAPLDSLQFVLVSPVLEACIGFAWQGFGSRGEGGYRGGFCEKLPEASPMSYRASASWIQDRPAAGRG